jgi:hypothetical protein
MTTRIFAETAGSLRAGGAIPPPDHQISKSWMEKIEVPVQQS